MPYSIRNGVKTYYEVAGEGPPMVLLHATPYDHSIWLYQIAHFSTWFRVIAPDSRCFGRSDKVEEPFDYVEMAHDIEALCAQENVKDAILMGGSLGCRLGVWLGHERPDLFKAVVLVGGNVQVSNQGLSDSDRRRSERTRKYTDGPLIDAFRWQLESGVSDDFPKTRLGRHLIDLFLERAPWLSGQAIARVFEASPQFELTSRLPDIKIPFLVITGEHDHSIDCAKETARLIPGGVHKTLPGTGHDCAIEDPAGFDTFVMEFLEQHWMIPKTSP
jgi:pimeloyl-ACP methyl ester carboxylesterase